MIIENKKTVTEFHLRRLLLVIFVTAAVVLLIYIKPFEDQAIDQKYLIFGLIICYFLYYFWGWARNYHYIYYSDLSPSKLLFRYYSMTPLSKRQNSIELRKDEFYKFEIFEKVWGFRKYLVLYQKTPRGIAKYPRISISMFNKKQIEELRNSLNSYMR